MLIKLYIVPTLLLLSSMVAMYFLTALSENFSKNSILSSFAEPIYTAAPWVGLILLTSSVLWAVWSSFRLWQWHKGDADACDNCGGLTRYIADGRYGPYYKCLACNKNRSAS